MRRPQSRPYPLIWALPASLPGSVLARQASTTATGGTTDGDARGHVPRHRPGRDPEAPRRRRGHDPGAHHRDPRPHADPDLRPGHRAADGSRRRVSPAHGAERAKARAREVREALHRDDDERAHGPLHGRARLAVRRARDLRQGRLPGRGDRADAAPRDGLLRDRRRGGCARDDSDRGDRGGGLGGAHARVPLEASA